MEALVLPIQINLRPEERDVVPASAEGPSPRAWRERPGVIRLPLLPQRHRWYLRWKSAADFLVALFLAAPAFAVVAVAALLVRLTSRGPAFYAQTRVGKNGRPFRILKIRTMIHNCESLTGPRWSMPGDPRITPVGWVLRKTHLDELPQLWNVLCGHMSLIGPRPERPEFVPELEGALPAYRLRLSVRPGVTGLAQVQLPADSDLGSVRRKLAYDLYYIEQLSPWLDLRLLFGTAFYAVGIPFRLLSKLLGIPGPDKVERAMQAVLAEQPPRARLSA
jgi:lipopolysaccharide/colanic/teichoic acid biosynthesis glycosyltransferase